MDRAERDKLIGELRAHLERRANESRKHIGAQAAARRAASGLAALDALIASERQAQQAAVRLYGQLTIERANALVADPRDGEMVARVCEYARELAAGGQGGGDGRG